MALGFFFAIIIIIIILVGLYFLFGLVDLWFRLSRSAGQGPLNWVDAFVLFYLFFFPFNCRARPSLEPFNFFISLNGGDLIFHLKPLKKIDSFRNDLPEVDLDVFFAVKALHPSRLLLPSFTEFLLFDGI